jgi:cell division septation protein DedD
MRRLILICGLLVFVAGQRGNAQADGPAISSPNDSVFQRAKRLVGQGNGVAGRALVDTMLKRATEGTTAYGDALYWRGALSETAAQAERDYRRVIVEYPLSPYADDALLGIAGLEQARGDRAGALSHMLRYVHDHPSGPARGVAALAAARLAFEQRDLRTGCSMISEARTSTPQTDIEAHNQIDYFGARCSPSSLAADSIASAPAGATSGTPVRDSSMAGSRSAKKGASDSKGAAIPSTSAVKTATARTSTDGSYTIQLAAYNTLSGAEQLVAELAKQGLDARVVGTERPFRVRLGFYPTREAAQMEIAALLKERGIKGMLATETLPLQEKKP